MKKAAKVPKTIDEYMDTISDAARPALNKVRASVKKAAPEASEKIGYRMPMFYHHGPLVAFASFSDHNSFFPMSLRVMAKFEKDLKDYDVTKGTIRFPTNKPLSSALVAKLVKARIAENMEKEVARKKRKSKKGKG